MLLTTTVLLSLVTDAPLVAAGYTHEYLVSIGGLAIRNGITKGMDADKLAKLFAGESIRERATA